MSFLVLRAFAKLIHFDFYLARANFSGLYNQVRNYRVYELAFVANAVETICFAVDVACVCYPKRVLCLQRSAVTTCLLKRNGVPAQMVIGAQHTPFKSHAWVEVSGQVANDKPYMSEIYAVLDRC